MLRDELSKSDTWLNVWWLSVTKPNTVNMTLYHAVYETFNNTQVLKISVCHGGQDPCEYYSAKPA